MPFLGQYVKRMADRKRFGKNLALFPFCSIKPGFLISSSMYTCGTTMVNRLSGDMGKTECPFEKRIFIDIIFSNHLHTLMLIRPEASRGAVGAKHRSERWAIPQPVD
jgi:hypothetical protein